MSAADSISHLDVSPIRFLWSISRAPYPHSGNGYIPLLGIIPTVRFAVFDRLPPRQWAALSIQAESAATGLP